MTRTVMDAALLMTALTKPDPRDFMALPHREIDWPGKLGGDVKGKRLGLVLEIGFGLAPQPAVRAAIEAAAKHFERAGATIEPIAPFLTSHGCRLGRTLKWGHWRVTQLSLATVLAYKGGSKQAWDNTDLAGPRLNGMRNSLNSQIWSFKEPNFLCVSATHGAAHLALFDQDMWDRYQLAKLAGGTIARNTFILAPPASTHDPADFQSAEGAFSSKDNSIVVSQRRGVVFMACHNAIWEVAERLAAADQNLDHLGVDALTAELTNHLIPEVVLTPGIVATLVKLQ